MSRAVRLVVVLATAFGMLVLTPGPSWACSCASRSADELTRAADTVVSAELLWTSTNGVTRTYGVGIDSVYKGSAAVREKLVSPADEAACGLGDLATNERYLFFVQGRHSGQMRVDLCGGSRRYDAALAHRIEGLTGGVLSPLPEQRDTVAAGTSANHWTALLGSVAGVLLVGAGVIGWRRRRSA